MMKATFRIHNTELTSTSLISGIGDYSFSSGVRNVEEKTRSHSRSTPNFLGRDRRLVGQPLLSHNHTTVDRRDLLEHDLNP